MTWKAIQCINEEEDKGNSKIDYRLSWSMSTNNESSLVRGTLVREPKETTGRLEKKWVDTSERAVKRQHGSESSFPIGWTEESRIRGTGQTPKASKSSLFLNIGRELPCSKKGKQELQGKRLSTGWSTAVVHLSRMEGSTQFQSPCVLNVPRDVI